jgi:hypothetical protein
VVTLRRLAWVGGLALLAACSDTSGLGQNDVTFNVSEGTAGAGYAPAASAKAGSGKIDLTGTLPGTLCNFRPAPEARFSAAAIITFIVSMQPTGNQCPAAPDGILNYTATVPDIEAGQYELVVEYIYPNAQPLTVLDTQVTIR